MRIKLQRPSFGLYGHCPAGAVVDWPQERAAAWIAAGLAEPVDPPPIAAADPAPKTAATPRPRRRRRESP